MSNAALLPPSASMGERAIAEAVSVRALPVAIADVWNPDTCPAPLLPWLAWALSVDGWEAARTDEQKRAAIRNSHAIHRMKGTVAAVSMAIKSLGYPARVIEWFDEFPAAAPYTFAVEFEVSQVPLDARIFYDIERLAASAKNARSHISAVRGIARTEATIEVRASTSTGEVIEVRPYIPQGIVSTIKVHARNAAFSSEVIEYNLRAFV